MKMLTLASRKLIAVAGRGVGGGAGWGVERGLISLHFLNK